MARFQVRNSLEAVEWWWRRQRPFQRGRPGTPRIVPNLSSGGNKGIERADDEDDRSGCSDDHQFQYA